MSVINTKTAGACTKLLHKAQLWHCNVVQNSNFEIKTKQNKQKTFKCVLIYDKVMKTRSIVRDREAGDSTVKWVKKLRVERGDASLLSGDKCK